MKTAISIPDDLFADAEQLARELKKSRSRLYGDAVREYVARHSTESITDSLDRVCEQVDCRSEFAGAAARRNGAAGRAGKSRGAGRRAGVLALPGRRASL